MDSSPGTSTHTLPVISFVLPCLNESQGLEHVVTQLNTHAQTLQQPFEIVIVDNGSRDASPEIAQKLSLTIPTVRTAAESVRGYGAATRHGIKAAYGQYVICLDADDTYTASDAITCASLLIQNPLSFVIGNRLTSPDSKTSMPWSHRVIGTPAISLLLRALFHTTITDPNCGLRGFSREKFLSLGCISTGMEFASETIARATHARMHFVEFPISYAPRIGDSKLRTIRDGIRHAYTIFATRLRLIGTHR
jgi:glycosyltransferase involved in cell wall biosynthesis